MTSSISRRSVVTVDASTQTASENVARGVRMTALTKQLGSQHRRELVAAPQAGPESPDKGKTDRGFAHRRDMTTSRDEAHVFPEQLLRGREGLKHILRC